MRTSTKLFFTSSVMLVVVMLLSALPSFGQTISGTVFRDFNSNGVYTAFPSSGTYSYGEPGVGGITVTAYNAAGVAVATTVSSTATASLGTYTLTIGNTNPHRVEFTNLGGGDYESFRATAAGNNATSVQFVTPTTATGLGNVNFGINYPLDYCQAAPNLVVPCYVNGNPLITGTAASEHVLVTLPYNSSGTAVAATSIADGADIGSVWGVAYQRETQKVFSSAFLKRHVGLGPAGLGGIYATTTSGTTTLLVDLENAPFNINLGQTQLGTRSTLPGSGTVSSTDPTAFSLVGTAGLGGMAFSSDSKILYVVDLYNRNLLALNVGNPAVAAISSTSSLTTIAIPVTGCTNGDFRPFAVSVKNNQVYVGGVCSGMSGTVTSGGTSDLYATVYSMQEGASTLSSTPTFSFRLNYTKGAVRVGDAAIGSTWQPWVTGFSQLGISSVTATGGVRVGRPQPMLTDITFADNGDMILDLADRTGFQLGYRQRNTTDNSATPTIYGGYIGGDLLRANYNGSQWVLENNGTVGGLTSAGGVGNGQGPGTPTTSGYNTPSGEFYYQESFTDPSSSTAIHQETSMGSGYSIPGYNVVVTTIMDPTDIFTGGIGWFNNRTGARTQSAELYNTLAADGAGTAGKANGLGGIQALCNPAPIEIGNRVWLDSNNNGIQDPGEPALAGVVVTLTGPGISGTATVTTNANGEYYFTNAAGTSGGGFTYGLTGLTAGGSYTLSFPTSVTASNAYISSKPNSATGANASNIDTDANSAGRIVFTLGSSGQNNFSYDAGYAPCVPPSLTALASSASVCQGGTVTLSAQVSPADSYTYAWSAPAGITLSGATTATATASSLTATGTRTFTVTVSTSPICSTTATVTVTVNALPTAALSSATICAGQSVNLTATGGTSYTFSNGTSNVTGILSVTPTANTTYSVTAVNANGCRSTNLATGTVTVNPAVTATLGSSTICAGQSVTLVASGGTSYTFSTGTTNTNGQILVVPTSTTAYSVTVINANGCVGTASGTVTVNTLPTAALTSATICVGQSATLIATGGSSYRFSNGTINNNGQLVVAPVTTTNYSVTVTNASGCTAVNTGSVTVNTLPTATLSSTIICVGQTANLVASGGTSYTFSNGAINNNGQLAVAPITTTNYSVTVANANGCISTATGTVTVNSLPPAALTSATICASQSVTLVASGGSSYSFSTGLSNGTGQLAVNPTTTTNYSVTVTNANGCVSTATGTVTVNSLPIASVNSPTICAGQSATLTATGGTSYTFSNGTNNNTGRLVTFPTSTTAYSVTVANASGCISTTTAIITVNPAVTATLSNATICAGQTATLTATGGTSYSFSTGLSNGTGQLAINPTTTTTYSVTVANSSGCIGTATGTVTVNSAVTATLSNATICAGQTATLTATGGTSYSFSTGLSNGTGQLAVTPTTTTTYSVTVSSNGCTGTASGTVTVNALPIAAVNSPTICAGQSATLTVTGGTAYTFSNGTTNNTGRLVTIPTSTTAYSVTVANGSGCISTITATITVNPAVTATLSNATICAGQTATLTATGGTSYSFSTGLSNGTGQLAVNPTTTTNYSVTVVNGSGCASTATGTVTVNPAVTATLSNATICAGQTATLTATGGTSYSFSTGLSNGTGQLVVSPTATTTYSVIVTNANGCVSTATGTVTVNSLPPATLSSATICAGQTATLTATGGTSYTFSTGLSNGTGQLVVSPTATTTYSVTVANASGCISTTTAIITVNPAVTATLSNATICVGQTATLTATGGTSYSFSTGLSNGTGQLAINPTTTTTYSVTVTNANGCIGTATGTVTVNTLPTATLSASPATICAGQTVTLTAAGGSSYRFSNGTTNSTGTVSVIPAAIGSNTYSVTVTNGATCSAIATTSVTVNPSVTATLSSVTICSGTSATLVAMGGSSYRFGPGNTNTSGLLVVAPTSTTTYSVTVTSAQGCSAVATGTVTVNSLPTPTISGNSSICAGQTITLTANPTTGLTYAWSGPGGSLGSSNPLTIANSTTANSGTYQVLVTNANGCTATASFNVTVKPAPVAQILSTSVVCTGNGPGVAIATQVIGGAPPVSYAWYRTGVVGVISTSANPIFSVADTYSLVVTDASGCVSNTASVAVAQPDPIAVNIQSTNAACFGQQGSITVTISGGDGPYSLTYANAGGVVSTQNTASVSSLQTGAGSYTVTVQDANGCTVVQSATISQPAQLTVSLTGSGSVCTGQATGSITSLVSGGTTPYTYLWSNGQTTPNLTNVSGGSYSVVVTDANSCTTSGTITLPISPLPDAPTFTATQPNCSTTTGSVIIQTPATGVQYSLNNGISYQASPTLAGLVPDVYQLRVRSIATGCVSPATNVTIDPVPNAPAVSIAGTTTICEGQSITLTASPGGLAYVWSGPGLGGNNNNPLVINNATIAQSGLYQVTVTDANSCSATASINVTVNPRPVATLSPATICVGQSATLTASGGSSYTFSTGTSNLDGSLVVSPTSTTAYSVTVANASGCVSTTSATVTVNQLPVATLSSATICIGNSATLTASGGTSYTFSTGLINTTGSLVVSPSSTTAYSVTVVSASGCVSTTTATIAVNQVPTSSLSSATICIGQSVTLTASGGASYTFSNGTTNNNGLLEVAPTATTTYSVTASGGTNCISSATGTVTVNTPPTAVFSPASPTICIGQSVTLVASGGSSYTFSDGTSNNTGALVVSPSSTTAYSVTVASASGCVSTTSVTVTVNQLPNLVLTPTPATICVGQSTTLVATGASSHTFSNGTINNSGRLAVSPTVTTIYAVTGVSASGCITSTTAVVTVNSLPTPTLSSATICVGQSATLTASGGSSYTFSTGTSNLDGSLVVSPTSTTAYSVTVANASGCISTTSGSVTVNPPPTAVFSPASPTICIGQSVTLVASGGSSYTFSDGTSNNTGALVVSPSSTTAYSVTVASASGCVSTTSVTVTVNQLPNLVLTPTPATICVGQSTTLVATGASSHTFSNGTINNSGRLAVSPTVTTTYAVTGVSASGCITSTTAVVTVNSLPTPTLSSATICVGQSATLTASGGSSYTFSTGTSNLDGSLVVSPTSTTAYSVTVANASGCISTTSGSVTVNPPPTAVFSPASPTICIGQSVTLIASGGSSYTFSDGTSNNTGALVVSPSSTTAYSVTVASASGCVSTTSVTVTVNQLPTATLTPTPATICVGQSATLAASGGTSYTFSNGTVNSNGQLVVAPTATTTYALTASSGSGCVSSTTAVVNVNSLPTPTLSSATICVGQSATLTASGGSSYTFSTGTSNLDGSLVVSPTSTTAYSVTVANASGCVSTTSATVTVNSPPTAVFSPASPTICIGQSVTLVASGGSSYTFSNGTLSTDGRLEVAPTATTTYSVIVANDNGCISTTNVTVIVNSLPTPAITSATICEGQTGVLVASGGTSYTFSTGLVNATGVLMVTPTTTTIYSVTVGTASGCISTTSGSVTVNELPVATISASSATICEGTSTTLTASGGASYIFSNGTSNTTGVLAVAPTTTTTYSVTVTSASGCTSTASTIVTVNPSATATLSSITICSGEQAILIASGGTSYTFSTGDVNSSGQLAISPTSTTVYSVTAINDSGCVSTTTTAATSGTVTVNAIPVANVAASAMTICVGQSVTLTASGGTSYNISGTINTSGVLVVTPVQTTTYVVTVTNASGCESTTAITITVNPLPEAALTSATICEGQSATLIASGGTSYTFSTSEVNSTGIFTVSPSSTTPYSVTVASASGCLNTATGSVTVNTVPVASLIPASATICEGQTVTLTASGGTTYSFSTGITNSTGVLIVSPSSTTAYSVTVSAGTTCSSVASATILVNPLPAATMTSATICEGQSATLVASGGSSYTFSNGTSNTTGLLVINPIFTTVYSVTVANASGCISTTSGSVTVNDLPVLTLTSETICAGLVTTLRATPGFATYIFSAGLTQIGTSNEATGSTNGTYSVTAITAAGCSATATGSILINSNPIVQLSSATICTGQSATLIATAGYDTYIFSPGLAQVGNSNVAVGTVAGTYSVTALSTGCNGTGSGSITIEPYPVAELASATICVGQPVTLTATGGTLYTFSDGTINTTGLLAVSPATTTTYSVTVANAAGCESTTLGTVTVNELPVAQLTSATICEGQSATLVASGGASYIFSTGVTNTTGELVVNPISTTTYAVTVVNASGCISVTSATVDVNTLPVAGLTSATACEGTSATLVASGGTAYTFSTGETNLTGILVVGPTATTTYSVTVANASGCISTTTATVTVNPLPTIVTTVACNGIATYDVSFTVTAGATVTANVGTIAGNQITGIPSGQIVTITISLNGCSVTEELSQNCQSNAAAIGNFVWHDLDRDGVQDAGEPGILDVVVVLLQNGAIVASTLTDANGFYLFEGLTPGIPYSVSFTTPVGFTATLPHQHYNGDDELDSDADPITGLTPSVTLAAGEYNLSLDAGFYIPQASLGNFVWNDLDHNGTQDPGEPGIPGVVVTLIQNGVAIASTTTDASGLYSFTGLTPGIPYSLSFTTPLNYSATVPNVGSSDTDSDPIGGITGPITLTAGENNTSIDAGFYLLTAGLGDFVFEDLNHNGQQDTGEAGIPNVVVSLISNGTLVASTTTDANGLYSFTGLTPNTPYSVSFTAPLGYSATLQNQGDDATDSDGNPATGLTGVYSLTANEFNPTVDMGYYRPASLNGYVWIDTDRNGTQGAGEPALPGVVVTLISNGTVVASTTTDASGLYSFTGLTPGVPYSLSFTTPAGFTATTPDQGGDDTIDSDAIGGLTPSVTLTSGQSVTQDAGFSPVTAGLGDYVFEDLNHNGQQDAGEPGIPGVTVSLIENGIILAGTTTTDANGIYSFTGLTPNTPYSVSFTAPLGYSATLQNQGDDATDSDGNPTTGLTGTYSLTASEFNPTVDMGYYRPASLGDYVWVDLNRDGIQDAGEPPLAGVVVTLLDGTNTPIASVTTTSTGQYSFTGLTPGVPYSLSFTAPTGYSATLPNQGGDDTLDSDPIGGIVSSITLASGENNTSVDAGFLIPVGSIGSHVWNDLDRDGQRDPGEPGVDGVTVRLLQETSPGNYTVVSTTVTTGGGQYLFTNLPAGTYIVEFDLTTLPPGFIISPNQNRPGVPTTENSDANPTTGRSAPITLDPTNPVQPDVLAIDAGLETDCPPAKCVPFVIKKTRGR
ncbi:hypothetical protein GCM10028807_20780 [Spirosoma daeguense]